MPFYLERARRSGGPVVELGVGTGRIAVPIAADGIHVIGVDSSEGMLEVARERATLAGVELDLRHGDLRDPPVEGAVPARDRSRSARSCTWRPTPTAARSLRAVHRLLEPGGRLHLRRLQPRPPTTSPRRTAAGSSASRASSSAPTGTSERRTLILRVRGEGAEAELSLAWLSVAEWRELLGDEGFVVEGLYGWFDRTPWAGHEDSILVCRRRD